jgi:hypothetical protein
MFHNGVARWFTEQQLAQVLRAHFDKEQMTLLRKTCPEAYRLWRPAHGFARRVRSRIYRALAAGARSVTDCIEHLR